VALTGRVVVALSARLFDVPRAGPQGGVALPVQIHSQPAGVLEGRGDHFSVLFVTQFEGLASLLPPTWGQYHEPVTVDVGAALGLSPDGHSRFIDSLGGYFE
jgi:hypothetical protein